MRVACIAAVASLLTLLAGCLQTEPARQSSVVLITIDTLRADHLSVYGYFRQTSPVLDRLAEEAVVFDNTVTTMATTLPAHASLMTSTRTTTHGLKGNFAHLGRALEEESSLRTAAEIFRDAGYQTAAFVGAAPVKDHTGLERGFQIFDQPDAEERTADVTADRVIEWLRSDAQKPYFLWLHFFDPHRPRKPPPPYDGAFATEPALIEFLERHAVARADDPRVQEQNNAYDGEILFTDSQIGRIFDSLESRGDWQNLAVVVTSDHGEGLGQHHWMRHGRIYNEQLFVPLIVKFPHGTGPEGARSARLASLVDVLPTLVTRLGLPISVSERSQFEGQDLLAAVEPRPGVLSEQVHRSAELNEPGLRYSLTNLRWKYFYRTEADDELYDMVDDRIETRNVLATHPEVAAEMKRAVLDILEVAGGRETASSGPDLDEEVVRQLQALGYMGQGSEPDAQDLDRPEP